MKIILILILGITNLSCSNKVENKQADRHIDSILEENEIDDKFEFFEGGSHKAEQIIHKKLIDFSIEMLHKNKTAKRDKYKYVPRDAHAKSHGCYKATFTVNNTELSREYRVGVFSENKTYDAYVRYSNNDHQPTKKDKGLDLRGMAIKLLNVKGHKVMSGHETAMTQDFLMYGSNRFFLKNNEDYIEFIKGLRTDSGATSLLRSQPLAAIKVATAQSKLTGILNPLELKYFSATPIRMGRLDSSSRTAAKYGAYPCKGKEYSSHNISDKKDHNYMRENLMNTLKKNKEACYSFRLQPRSFPDVMPIEDATVEWPEKKSLIGKNRKKFQPYIEVAKVLIKFDENKNASSKESREICENLSFNPWHTISEHKPLGRTMRMRRDIYRAISDYRRNSNKVSTDEPTSFH
jgi:hypothetical protein